jgi:hypothetical protein
MDLSYRVVKLLFAVNQQVNQESLQLAEQSGVKTNSIGAHFKPC